MNPQNQIPNAFPGIHNMGDLELFVKSGELLKLYSPSISYKKRGKVSFFSHAVKDYCAGAIRICKGFFFCRLEG